MIGKASIDFESMLSIYLLKVAFTNGIYEVLIMGATKQAKLILTTII